MTGPTEHDDDLDRPWLSVIVPAYNEEAVILGTLEALLDRLDGEGRPYEVIVVDNASEDSTVAVLQPLVAAGRVRVLRNEVNRGKGYSVRRGMLDARGELRLMCDADCGPSLASLPAMVAAADHADVVCGSRVARGANVGRDQPPLRRFMGWGFITLCRTVMSEPVHDVFCGFKLWRREVAEAAFARQTLEGWSFDAEVLAMARRFGYRVVEVGVSWSDREGSRLVMHRVLLPVLRELVQARRNVARQPRGVAGASSVATRTALAAASRKS